MQARMEVIILKIAMLLDNPFIEGLPYPKRVYYEAKSLVQNGYDVTLFCKNERNMNIPKFEIRDEIKIKRTFDYFLGTTVLVDKYLTAHFDLMNSIDEKYDVYHCHDIFTWPVGYILSKRDNAKFICETHEFFPDYICKEWHTDEFKYRITKMLIKTRGEYIKYADKVITVSGDIAVELQKKFKLNELPTVIYNTRPRNYVNKFKNNKIETINYLKDLYNIDSNVNIMLFQGLLQPERGLDIAIKAIKHLENCVLIIAGASMGDYINDLKKLVSEIKAEEKVIFTGFMSSDDLFKYSSYADFLIYFGKREVRNMDLTIPNKFFDYIMAGKPIISSNLKAVFEIINRYNIGITLDIENTSAIDLAKKIQSYISNKELVNATKKNIKNIQKYYSWEKQEEKLLRLYKDLE